MLETVLMRTFLMFYVADFEADEDRCPYMSGKSGSAERRAFSLLASVCWGWYLTLTGWPQSSTGLWVRHQLKKLIKRAYFAFIMVALCNWGRPLYFLPCGIFFFFFFSSPNLSGRRLDVYHTLSHGVARKFII